MLDPAVRMAAALSSVGSLLALAACTAGSPAFGGGGNGAPLADASSEGAAAGLDGAVTTDAGSSTDAGGEAGGEDAAVADAGTPCLAPDGEAPLSATTEGFPTQGLVLWLRADHGVSKTADQSVCAWADQSGAGVVLQGNDSARPIWSATAVGAQAGIDFTTGEALRYAGDLGTGAGGARTFVVVQQLVSTTGRFQAIGQAGQQGGAIAIDTNTWQTQGSLYGVYADDTSYDSTQPTSTAPSVHVLTVDSIVADAAIAGAIDYRVDGKSLALTARSGTGDFAGLAGSISTYVGSAIAGGQGSPTDAAPTLPAEAIVTEVLVYDRALAPDERSALESALATRYGTH
jgi:hypothetical protein